MAPAVVRMVSMPDAFEDTKNEVDADINLKSFSTVGCMGSGVAKGDPSFEATLRRAASTPGPSDYSIASTLNRSGGRFAYTLSYDDYDDATVNT